MSNVLTKKPTEVVETTDEPPAHYTCPVCNPERHLGMKAVCGAELLGIEAPDDCPTCEPCSKIWAEHLVEQHDYPRDWV